MITDQWTTYHEETVFEYAEDIYTPAGHGSMMRSRMIDRSGLFRLSRRDSSLYSVEIKSCGSWGRILLYNGEGRLVFYQPSTFTGSFVLEGYCHNGIYLHSNNGPGVAALLMINWREPDREIV